MIAIRSRLVPAVVALACLALIAAAVALALPSHGARSSRPAGSVPGQIADTAQPTAPSAQSMTFWGPTGRARLRLYPTPTPGSQPTELVADGRGGYWFTEQRTDKLGHLSRQGRFHEYAVPSAHSEPFALALDADGNVWFTELGVGKLGRIERDGRITEYALHSRGAQPYALATGPGGKMWFTEYGTGRIGNVDRQGRVTEFRLPTANAAPAGITRGADQNMWVAESGYEASGLAKVTPAGRVTEYSLPGTGAQPFGIVAFGRRLWVTEFGAGKIAVAKLSGQITEYRLPTAGATPFALTVLRGGAVWFTEPGMDQLGKLSVEHGRETIVEYPLPQEAAALDLAPGPRGTLWTTEFILDSLGSFTP